MLPIGINQAMMIHETQEKHYILCGASHKSLLYMPKYIIHTHRLHSFYMRHKKHSHLRSLGLSKAAMSARVPLGCGGAALSGKRRKVTYQSGYLPRSQAAQPGPAENKNAASIWLPAAGPLWTRRSQALHKRAATKDAQASHGRCAGLPSPSLDLTRLGALGEHGSGSEASLPAATSTNYLLERAALPGSAPLQVELIH